MSGEGMHSVFISYSHDSPAHAKRVLELANQLRREGVDAWIDRYKPNSAEGWPRWMEKQIDTAKFVLAVCSLTYRRRFEGEEEPGRGVTWEGFLASKMRQEAGGLKDRLIPVMFEGGDEVVPTSLRPYRAYKLPEQYHDLYRRLTSQRGLLASLFGKKRKPQVKQGETKKGTIALPVLQASTSGAPDPSRVKSPFIVGSPAEEPEHFFGRQLELEEIRHALAQRQPVQLVGETRMGKTSLLGRVPELLPKDRPVVRINAKGLAGHSSKDMVLAIAHSLDRRPEVESRTKDERTDSFLTTIELLAPCAVLIDEADAIAQGGHGFDKRFFEQCRTLCQRRRLIWVSASHSKLGVLFQRRGLASRFLNESKIVQVGQLDSDAADALVSVLGPALAGRARELAGGFPLGLQWLGHELWRNGDQPSLAEDYANAMRMHFTKWWERLDDDERRLLKRACVGVARARLGDSERSKLAALVQRGLAEQVDGTFGVPGAGWRRFVGEGDGD
jgi:hypothetical protein